jgi:hypothetical protein
VNELLRSNNDAAHGRTETLGQTDADRVEAGAVFFQIHAFNGNGVEETRSIQVHGNRLLAFFDRVIPNKLGDLFGVF